MNRSIIKPNNPIKNIAAKTSSKFNIFLHQRLKPNPDCAPIISPETKNIQLVPTAICIPAMICLNAPEIIYCDTMTTQLNLNLPLFLNIEVQCL